MQEFFGAFFGSLEVRSGDEERAEDEVVCFGYAGIKKVMRVFDMKSLTVMFNFYTGGQSASGRVMLSSGCA